MKEKKLDYAKFNEIYNELPQDLFHDFFYVGLLKKSMATKLAYVRDLKYFLQFAIDKYPYFPDKQLKEITASDLKQITVNDINHYLAYIHDELGHSDATTARKRSSLSKTFEYLLKANHYLDFNPVSGSISITLPEKDEVKFLRPDEQEMLLNTIRTGAGLSDRAKLLHKNFIERDLAMVFLFLDTGMRVSELQSIDVGDIDFRDCKVYVRRKRDKYQNIYFSDESKEYINDYLEHRKHLNEIITDNSPLFTTAKGTRISIRAIQNLVDKYTRAAVGRKFSPHKLRSSFAMQYYRATDNDILSLQRKLGHKSIQTTNVYAKATDEEMKLTRNWRNQGK